jgi:uncharacterized GH25 family protein
MRNVLCLVALCVGAPPVSAHYNMLHPSAPSGKKDEAVTFTYQWGHPFEHQLFEAPKPELLLVFSPDGKTENLTKKLEKVALPAGEGKTVAGYRFTFTPEQRGDYTFVLRTPPIFLEEDAEFVQDTVKVVYHVQAQKGWDTENTKEVGAFNGLAPLGSIPLTRPYGLEPGLVFQTQILALVQPTGFGGMAQVQPLPGATVEVERYNATPPKKLPPDEQITRVVKTDPSGVATCTLTDPGWWCVTASNDGGKAKHDGKEYPLRRRATLWVFVDEKAK